MKENELIRHFNKDLNSIITRQTIINSVDNDYAQLIDIASKLSNFSSVAISRTQSALRKRLMNQVESYPHTKTTRPRLSLVSALGIFVILVLFSLAIPPVRTFAQDVIKQIGNFFFVNQPTYAENYVATMQSGIPTPTMAPTQPGTTNQQVFEVETLSYSELNEKAGFEVYKTVYIPEGYTLEGRDVLKTSQTTTADTSYRKELDPPLHDGTQFSGIISLQQTLTGDNTDPWITGIGDIPVVEVTVRNVKGVWIEQLPVYPFQNENGEWEYARWNQLIWSENGFSFMLQTNMPSDLLPLEEMIKIADSLTQ